jgi:hypothetical protein
VSYRRADLARQRSCRFFIAVEPVPWYILKDEFEKDILPSGIERYRSNKEIWNGSGKNGQSRQARIRLCGALADEKD